MGHNVAKKTPLAPGKAARQSRSRKKPGVKPGKQSWVFGTKLVFFEARSQDWRDANALGNLGLKAFYTKVTSLYFLKYGYDLKDNEDLDEDTEDPTDPDAMIEGSDTLSQEEAAARSATNIVVRKRIAAWYCRTYRGLEAREKNVFAEIMARMDGDGPNYPRRAQPIHFYSRRYYDERVKARFEARWKIEMQRSIDLEMPVPEAIKIRNEVTAAVFEEETEEFRAELLLAVEAEHVSAVRAWELTHADTQTKTPQEINAALKNAAFYLEPLANTIREKFMLNCTILLCGPMGDRGGAIEVRSVHAGTTRGLTPRKWYQADPLGYEGTERSFIKFSERCFSEADCLARAVGVEQVDETIPTPSTSAQTTAVGSATTTALPGSATTTTSTTSPTEGSAASDDATAMATAAAATAASTAAAATAAAATAAARNGGEGGGDDRGGGGGGDDHGGGDAATATRTAAAEALDNHPAWQQNSDAVWSPEVTMAYKVFCAGKTELGVAWADCVESWIALEEASGFNNEGGQLTAKERPAVVGAFINGARRWDRPREIVYVGTKAEEGTFVWTWWAWWREIQKAGNLERMCGRTGLMLVVGSLLWWGAKEHPEEWEEAAKTVTATMREVVASGKIVKKVRSAPKKVKRTRDAADEDDTEEEEGGEEGRVRRRKRAKHGDPEPEATQRTTRGSKAATTRETRGSKAVARETRGSKAVAKTATVVSRPRPRPRGK
ncbi:hypothetical protein C8R46DRAFT_1208293 [Mycena filopes]|nr:hypothetical protein C8R46DRAFT_1208293 [Mycena filopes]